MNTITVDQILALGPCYDRDQVRAALGEQESVSLAEFANFARQVPAEDARWVLARLLSVENRVVWAKACAERAKGYAAANATYAAAGAAWAAWAAARAAAAAADAADAAEAAWAADAYAARAADAARAAERNKQIDHAIELLGGQP